MGLDVDLAKFLGVPIYSYENGLAGIKSQIEII